MASTFVNNLRLEEMATGEQSGNWGTKTNTNLELIGEALGFATVNISSDADQTETVADASSDSARAIFIKVTSATLSATRTLTIAPNTMKRLHIIENATSGSQSINISQGSGGNVTIPNGQTKVVYLDGAGSGAAVVDAFTDLNLGGTTVVDDLTVSDDLNVGDDVNLTSDEAVLSFGANSEIALTHVHDTGLKLTDSGGTPTLQLHDSNEAILSDGTNLKLTSGGTTFTIPNSDGSDGQFLKTDGSGALSFGTVSTTTALDDIATGDAASTLATSAGNITIDAQGSDTDIIFKGTDGSTDTTFLTLDGSDAGAATFNAGATFGGTLLPAADDTHDLGSSSKQWRDIYTGDINLNNTKTRDNEVDGTRGSWTIQEGADDLFLLNRLNGKKYKFKLEEM
tara:strand:+ start:388 stop:1581 length:1194 start_codon:yes stop_codon:yes gene_type:complete